MTITFFSNFLNDHQLPLCLALQNKVGKGNFHFVACEKIDPDRIKLGFKDMNQMYDFVVKSYESTSSLLMAQDLMLHCDIVIIGTSKQMPTNQRLKEGKLTFRYNERILKRGDIYWFDPRIQHSAYIQWGKHRKHNLYELCASAYTARDLSLFGFPKNKCFKWGYFPIVKRYEDIDNLIRKKQELKRPLDASILWVGRLIEWKHPEVVVWLASELKKENFIFKIDVIGIGEQEVKLRDLIKKYNVADCVKLLGAMPPSDVRKHMEEAEIFLFTSDKNEGWGAVLNEAMNSACAVVANNEIGSVPFLLKHNYNGLVYQNGNVKEMVKYVKQLIEEPSTMQKLGKNAYLTLINEWNAEKAVDNLFNLIDCINNRQMSMVTDGPCSFIK